MEEGVGVGVNDGSKNNSHVLYRIDFLCIFAGECTIAV